MKQMGGSIIDNKLIVSSIEHMVVKGRSLGASFVHIEPRANHILIRYRVGNELVLGSKLPLDVYEQLLITLKNQSGLDTKKTKKITEGKINISENSESIIMSILPIFNGEKIVFDLRQGNASDRKESLLESGYWGKNLYLLNKSSQKTEGLIIISSQDPLGSIQSISNIANNLEYQGIQMASLGSHIQAQLPKSLTISTSPNHDNDHRLADHQSLKILLKRNPDAIFISYPSESKVFNLALKEAENKLICIALNSDNCAGILSKLIKISEIHELKNISVICSQKNVKRLCANCRESFKPSKKMIKSILLRTGKNNQEIGSLEAEAMEDGIGEDMKHTSSDEHSIHQLFKAKKGGCIECGHTGYIGNINIVELLDFNRDRVSLMIHKNNLSPKRISEYLSESGFINMQTDCLIKALRGLIEYSEF